MSLTERNIIHAIRYFAFFNYAPTGDEIYSFLKTKAFKRHFTGILDLMIKKSLVVTIYNDQFPITNKIRNFQYANPELNKNLILDIRNYSQDNYIRYTLPEYSNKVKSQKSKVKLSQEKIRKIERYVKLLSLFPQIKLVGLSGTVAMMDAEEDDDIDLFIITAGKRLFTGRFIALTLAQFFNLRRKRITDHQLRIKAKNKVCLNLFFDESDMLIPKRKRTEYVAHEVLQMKPVVVRGDVYDRFLKANGWVFDIFPNSKLKIKIQKSKLQFKIQNFKFLFVILHLLADGIELLLKGLQLSIIRKHQTKELITPTQLWFHPKDFGEKMDYTSFQ